MKTIQELFDDWVEPDAAEYYLACLLGIMHYDDSWIVRKNSRKWCDESLNAQARALAKGDTVKLDVSPLLTRGLVHEG